MLNLPEGRSATREEIYKLIVTRTLLVRTMQNLIPERASEIEQITREANRTAVQRTESLYQNQASIKTW